MSPWKSVLIVALTVACPLRSTAEAGLGADWSERQWGFWHYLIEELEIQEFHARLSGRHQPTDFVVRNVNLITMADPAVRPNHSVAVRDGLIAQVGPDGTVGEGLTSIDGGGAFLLPGLTDMHVHNLDSHSQHLLNLAHGVTTVRDLDGFPWMLRMRANIDQQRLLAPKLYLSGTILNGSSFGGYAQVVSSPEQAREAVRAQARAGYDFIKTHNSLSLEIFEAIANEARVQGLDLVGHIPVGVTVEQAVALNMRTFEHFKGYIIDSTLTLSSEDYLTATDGAEVWNTPTFTTYRTHLRGTDAARLLATESEMRYASPRLRRAWTRFVDMEPDRVTKLRQNIYPLSRKIFADLRTIDARFLAGTDSGSYEFMPPGIVLHEELRIFQELGMSPFEALQTATINPAAAMRRPGQFGVIAPGARADLLLVAKSPLENLAHLGAIEGVGVRGVWLTKHAIDDLLGQLLEIFADSRARLDRPTVDAQQLDDFHARMVTLANSGFVLRDHYLELAASLFDTLKDADKASQLRAFKTDADFSFAFLVF